MPKVGELILLAAPSCCGKTYFLRELLAGRLNHILVAMKIEAPIDSYHSVIPKQISSIDRSYVSRILMHYALPTIALNDGSLRNLDDDPRLEIIKHSKRVTVLALVTSPGILTSRLIARNKAHRIFLLTNLMKYFRERRRFARLKQLYADPAKITAAYDALFTYCDSLSNLETQWLVTADDNYEVFSQREWPTIRDSYLIDSKAV